MDDAPIPIEAGMNVCGSDGEKIGEVFQALPGWFVVTKGVVFPTDHYIPLAAVDRIDAEGAIVLSVTKDEALEQGWGTDPAGFDANETAADPNRAQPSPPDHRGGSHAPH